MPFQSYVIKCNSTYKFLNEISNHLDVSIQFDIIFFIKFLFQFLNYTVLYAACKNGNTEIVDLLLACEGIDANVHNILNILCFK